VTKDELRVAVLRYHYSRHQMEPGVVEQTAKIAFDLGLDFKSVAEAQFYLSEKGFLRVTSDIGGLGESYTAYMTHVTGRGIDFVEHPTDFRGGGIPIALVNIVAGGDVSGVTVAGRDQQVVHGDIKGPAIQGGMDLPLFPIEQVRTMLAGRPEALAAAEEVNAEVSSGKPRWAKVLAAIEVMKGVTAAANFEQLLMGWASHAAIPGWVHQAVTALMSGHP
jgi:hypothetical protein